jgi:hypothetical protein
MFRTIVRGNSWKLLEPTNLRKKPIVSSLQGVSKTAQ